MKYIIALLSLLLMQNAIAQPKKQINEITIKGRKKTVKERAEFKQNAQSTEAINSDELDRNNSAFIEQSLSTMAGVQVDKRTQLGGQRIVIRGYGNDQKFNNWGIKAYYNGIPLTTADGVTVLDDVDFGIVDNIEVIKGPAATMYGAGVGGVARFYLKNSDQKGITLSQKFTLGSFNLLQTNSRVDVVGDNASVSINYGHIQSDGYRPNGRSNKNNVTIFGDLKVNDKDKINVYASQNYSYEGVSGQISYADYYAGIDKGNIAYIRKNASNNFLSTRIGIANTYQFSPKISNNTSLFYSTGDYIRIAAGAYENSTNLNYGLRSVFTYKENLNTNITNDLNIGTEMQQSKSHLSNYRFTGNVDTPLQVQNISKGSYFRNTGNQTSFFIQDRITYKPYDMALILGISANKISYTRTDLLALPGLLTTATYGKNLGFSQSFDASINPHIALQKSYKKQIFNLSYSQGYNAPTAATAFIGTINKTNDSLMPEKAHMLDFSVQGLLADTKLDYQVSVFDMNIKDKLTQLNGKDLVIGTAYSYWANTGIQHNQGLEASIGYVFVPKVQTFLKKMEPFVNYAYYTFTYKNFNTKTGSNIVDYSGKQVVGVPQQKLTLGLDFKFAKGIYLNNTLNCMGKVYTDFANTNLVKGYNLLNSKIGYKNNFCENKLELEAFVGANNLLNAINYTFLFLGNNINDTDPNNGYPAGVTTDVNPGYNKAYFYGGVGVKYRL